jgi:hypothetical protein
VIALVISVVDHKYALAVEDVSTTAGLPVVKVVELPAVIIGFDGADKVVIVLTAD